MSLEPEEVRVMHEKGEKTGGSGELDFQEGGSFSGEAGYDSRDR